MTNPSEREVRLKELIRKANEHDSERWNIGEPRAVDCAWCDIVLLVEALATERKKAEEKRIIELGAISTAAIQNTEKTKTERIPKDNSYWTVAYGDVCDAVDREMAWRKKAEDGEKIISQQEKTITEYESPLFADPYKRLEKICQERNERISALEAEIGKFQCASNDTIRELKAEARVRELEGLLSQDTSEWKSSAFQKIKALEAKLKDSEQTVRILALEVERLQKKIEGK